MDASSSQGFDMMISLPLMSEGQGAVVCKGPYSTITAFLIILGSNSQDSPDVENTSQSTCYSPASNSSTESPIVNTSSSPQQSRNSMPVRTCEAPEDADGDKQPAAPPTPKPWLWECHKCYVKYSVEATTRCLNDGHYFCYNFQSRRNRRRKHKRPDWEDCEEIFDYSGWKNMRAWQKQWRQGQGTGEERESGCMNDCVSPSYCKSVAPTPLRMTEPLSPEKQLDINAPAGLPLNDSNSSFSSRDGDAKDKVRAGSKRASSQTTNVPPEAPPAKRRMLTFTRLDLPTKKRFRNKPLLIGSPLKIIHCCQTTFFNPIDHARDIGICRASLTPAPDSQTQVPLFFPAGS